MLFNTVSAAIVALALCVPEIMAVPTWGPPQAGSSIASLVSKMPKSALASPDGLTLKFVALGVGTQNYTCLTKDDNAEPVAAGAVAKLYNLGQTLSHDPLADFKINTISALALNMYYYPAILSSLLWVQGFQQILGDHFFAPTTPIIPTFDFNKVQSTPHPIASVKKFNETDAPKNAFAGTKGEGAVKWLQLIDNGKSQGGVTTVYRLQTAGGKAPKLCKGSAEHFEVPYTAQYWVFGQTA